MDDDKSYENDPDYPCQYCDRDCDTWEARYCCTLCEWLCGGVPPESYCDDCNPEDI